ncbi:MAG: type I-C CRISPR-associated protein Cas5 [Chthonomonadales bacterium]|nr:type I-C CRISPR-associated protein Cas5 [Chthonomonadales bacterium]
MSGRYPPVAVKVWGEYACFTRPEAKVERVSYEVPTPSAARGILEAICFHKPMRWQIREIAVLERIRHFSILRNEVTARASPRVAGLRIGEDRAQRHTLGLRDVAYVIRADVWVPPGSPDDPAKYRDQFRRRVSDGQCFHRPYLGCREFAAHFAPVDGSEKPVDVSSDLGLMLFDIAYGAGGAGNRPRFFEARLDRGVLRVPPELYDDLYGGADDPAAVV